MVRDVASCPGYCSRKVESMQKLVLCLLQVTLKDFVSDSIIIIIIIIIELKIELPK